MTKKIDTLADLTPDGENFNKHTEFGQKLLEDSLRKFGAGRSILVDKDGKIIAGNSTTETAAAIGMEDVIVVHTDGKKLVVVQRTDLSLDSPEGRELALADNMTALKGIDLDLAKVQETLGDDLAKAWGMDIPEVQKQAQEDDFDPDKPVETVCKKGDIWKLGNHRLMCGDSFDRDMVGELLSDAKVQFTLTDPPYGTTAISWDKPIDLEAFFKIVYEVNVENAAIAVFGAQPFTTDLINAGRKTFRYDIIWEKTMKSMFLSAYRCPLRTHEIISVFYKKQPIFNPQKYGVEEKRRVRHVVNYRSKQYNHAGVNTYINDGTRFYGDVLHFSSWNGALFGNNENATNHPTQKPVELIAHLERMYTNEGDTILDLFGGSGTTLIAAEQLNRKCFMMELDPHYCNVIIARWEKLTGNKAERISNGND